MKRFSLFSLLLTATLTAQAQQSPYLQAVDEYVPAPGQFVNKYPAATEADTPETMAQKCTEQLAANAQGLVSLGAWGGYITFHFDHPVINVEGQADFAVWGNAFENNAEPATVWVSVDANHNQLPDDAWYELRGSEYDHPLTVHRYQLTYYFGGSKQDVLWTDNQGHEGSVVRNKYNKQEYFPLWLTDQKELTLSGTRLPDNAILQVGDDGSQLYLLPAFSYGYADNQPNTNREGCAMNLEWAVDSLGRPVALTHADFIRCQNGMNQVCGAIGETSTEITGAEDLHPNASAGIASLKSTNAVTPAVVCNLRGLRTRQLSKGLNIVRTPDGNTRKIIIQ
ncbi:MAG: hypothetical protein IKQ05_04880 [Prevotella sp.]|nr:hypothetical protein [Prevotella sp.]